MYGLFWWAMTAGDAARFLSLCFRRLERFGLVAAGGSALMVAGSMWTTGPAGPLLNFPLGAIFLAGEYLRTEVIALAPLVR